MIRPMRDGPARKLKKALRPSGDVGRTEDPIPARGGLQGSVPLDEAINFTVPVRFVTTISRNLERLFLTLASLAIVGLVLTIFVNIVRRSLTGQSFTWSDSVASIALAWSIFLAAPVCVRKEANPSFGVFRDRLKGNYRAGVDFVGSTIQISALVSIVRFGLVSVAQLNNQSDPVTGWSFSWIEIVMPASALAMAWFVAANLCEEVASRRGAVRGAVAAAVAIGLGIVLSLEIRHLSANPTVVLIVVLVVLLSMGIPIAITTGASNGKALLRTLRTKTDGVRVMFSLGRFRRRAVTITTAV